MTALEGIWKKAEEEWQTLQPNFTRAALKNPEYLFCQGFVFGAAFGLALSTVRPDLVKTFEPIIRERGWLDEHDGYKND